MTINVSDSARISARSPFWFEIYKASLLPEGVSERECAKFALDRAVKEVAGNETRTSLTGGVAATVIDKTK